MSLRPRRPVDLDARLAGTLTREPAPDLTNAIMERLGFAKMGARQARAHLAARAAARAGMIMAVGCVMGGLLRLSNQSAAPRPEPITLPHAVQRDILQQQIRFDTFIRYLRERTPSLEGAPQRPLEDDMDRSAIGPVRWI